MTAAELTSMQAHVDAAVHAIRLKLIALGFVVREVKK